MNEYLQVSRSSRGEMTVAEVIDRFIVAHAKDHVAQIRATLQP